MAKIKAVFLFSSANGVEEAEGICAKKRNVGLTSTCVSTVVSALLCVWSASVKLLDLWTVGPGLDPCVGGRQLIEKFVPYQNCSQLLTLPEEVVHVRSRECIGVDLIPDCPLK
jgi:hypothetical protein